MRRWPDTLSTQMMTNYQLTAQDQSLRTDMEVGAQRLRRVTTARLDRVSMSWRMTDAEFAAFRAWHDDDPWSIAGASDDLTGWSLVASTITPDTIVGPDGQLADLVAETAVNSTHAATFVLTGGLPNNTATLVRATLRAQGRGFARLALVDKAGVVDGAVLNLTTGALTGPTNLLSQSVQDRGNGWWRVTLTASSGVGAVPPEIRINLFETAGVGTYLGDGGSGVAVCEVGARLVTGFDLHLRTGADGRALGAAGGTAWVQMPVAQGGGMTYKEARFAGPYSAKSLSGLHWELSAPVEVRNA